MYGKIVDGKFVKAESIIYVEDKQILNPTEETLYENGYKIVEETDCPNIEGLDFDKVYTDTEDSIKQEWIQIN